MHFGSLHKNEMGYRYCVTNPLSYDCYDKEKGENFQFFFFFFFYLLHIQGLSFYYFELSLEKND